MIFLCGGLALLSLIVTALSEQWAGGRAAGAHPARLALWLKVLLFKMAAVPIGMLALFLIFWLLPNRRVPAGSAARLAILAGLVLEAMKYAFLLLWPLVRMKLESEYGVFHNAATITIWSFVCAMIVLAAAEWAAREGSRNEQGLEEDRAS
jgi:uncharacterized BrkB/YihY/UPF0761 family membrane protein